MVLYWFYGHIDSLYIKRRYLTDSVSPGFAGCVSPTSSCTWAEIDSEYLRDSCDPLHWDSESSMIWEYFYQIFSNIQIEIFQFYWGSSRLKLFRYFLRIKIFSIYLGGWLDEVTTIMLLVMIWRYDISISKILYSLLFVCELTLTMAHKS